MEPADGDRSLDPGWTEAVRGAWMFIVPFGFQLRVRHADNRGVDGLVLFRALFLGFIGSLLGLAVVMTFLDLHSSGAMSPAWVTAGLVGYGLTVILFVTPRFERPLVCDSDLLLAASFRTRFFLRVAFAQSIGLFGFVLAFQCGSASVFYVGVVVSILGMLYTAPTQRDLAHDQAELRARGCERSLVAALRGPQIPPVAR